MPGLEPRTPGGGPGAELKLQGSAVAFPAGPVVAGESRSLAQCFLVEQQLPLHLLEVQRVEGRSVHRRGVQALLRLLELQREQRGLLLAEDERLAGGDCGIVLRARRESSKKRNGEKAHLQHGWETPSWARAELASASKSRPQSMETAGSPRSDSQCSAPAPGARGSSLKARILSS